MSSLDDIIADCQRDRALGERGLRVEKLEARPEGSPLAIVVKMTRHFFPEVPERIKSALRRAGIPRSLPILVLDPDIDVSAIPSAIDYSALAKAVCDEIDKRRQTTC